MAKENENAEEKVARKQVRRLVAVLTIDKETGKPCIATDEAGTQLVAPPTQVMKHMNAITTLKAGGEVAEVVEIVYDPEA